MIKTNKSTIVFPTGQTASQNDKYFEAFEPYMADENVGSSIVIYPKTLMKVIDNAICLTKKTSLVPVPIQDPYSGVDDFPYAIKLMFSSILRNSPDVLHVVTSGGTTKIGNLAVLTGNLAEKFGIDVHYIWAAKDKHGVYCINRMPKIVSEKASDFDVIADAQGNIRVLYPVN